MPRRRALSLVEVLVVIAIMAAAMGILLIVFSKVIHVVNSWR